jgi:hypothetical protein
MGYILHGAIQGGADPVVDAAMLCVPVVIAGVVLIGPRLLARRRSRDAHAADAAGLTARGRNARPSHHGDEPI